MSKKRSKDWKPWQENLAGFIATGALTIMTYFFYYESLFKESSGTKGKVLQHFMGYLNDKFGKEYVFGFLILVMLLFGISALRGYLKCKKDKFKN